MPRLSKIGAAALAAFGWTSGVSAVSASYLVVAGGGSGGRENFSSGTGGGGGAGGLRTGTLSLDPALSYTVTVGAGGAVSGAVGTVGSNGSNSVFSAITSTGGGGGGGGTLNPASGAAGGSGGGAASTAGGTTFGAGTVGQGNNGGTGGGGGGGAAAGGGGGAGAVGGNATTTNGGAGGAGTASSITGASVNYAGGGGGSSATGGTGGAGGAGGGGTGAQYLTGGATAGTANLGGGGGGGSNNPQPAGAGGSGIVIISYVGAQQFGGGVVTTSGGNTIHTFTTSGTLVPVTPLTASALVVAGGGGGSGGNGGSPAAGAGGGGAGGYRTGSGITIDTNSIYLITVGAGGAGGVDNGLGVSGSDSLFLSTTSTGGGRGGSTGGVDGATGGSGGGGQGKNSGAGGAGNTPSTSPSQGSNGGAGGTSVGGGGGGGGGATATGTTATSASGGAGGAGTASSLSGASVTYAGGGGGGNQSSGSGGTGGSGGGGAGGTNAVGTAGTANLGGGGGGGGVTGSNSGFAGGAGGSGVVIISYAGATQLMAGGTVTISGGNVIHTFTSSGYLTPIKLMSNSLRFRSSASASLSRTFVAGDRTKFTWSGWVKRGALTGNQNLFGPYTNSTGSGTYGVLRFVDGAIEAFDYTNGTNNWYLATTSLYRDPAAWYHIQLAVDTTQATSSNRIKLYVNGVQLTAFTTATYPSASYQGQWNNALVNYIGYTPVASQYFDGYLAEVNFIDGQALTPNSFGTINSYGVWQPITYGGSYGTNGFYLPFTNQTSATTLSYDFSPNGNNWTPVNISTTAGTTYDSMTDVPTLTSATAANFAVANPLSTLFTVTAGNMDFTYTNSTTGVWYLKGTLAVSSDKYYWEVIPTNVGAGLNISIGIILSSNTQTNTTSINLVTDGYVYHSDGNKYSGSSGAVAYGATYTNNDVIGVALDLTAGTLVFYKNNVSQGTAFTGLTSSYMQLICNHLGGTSRTVAGSVNAGQRPFTYTAPSGFVALNTYNL